MALFITAPGLDKLVQEFGKKEGMDWRQTRQAIEKVAEIIVGNWQQAAQNPKASQAKWFGQQYGKSITIKERRFSSREMSVTIGPKGAKGEGAARVVEEGRPRYDMKPALLASKRARSGKKGRYIIVSFRHGMQIVQEAGVGGDFKKLKSMEKIGSNIELNAFGEKVSRNVYSFSSEGFGTKLGKVGGTRPQHKHLTGLMKTKQPVKGGGVHEQALTMRTVSSKSTGWMFPSIPAQRISQEIAQKFKEDGMDILKSAIKADLLRYISGTEKL